MYGYFRGKILNLPIKNWHMKSGYLNGVVYDHVLVFGVMLLAVISGLTVLWKPELFPIVFFADLWFLGYHHVIATFTKLAGISQDRKDNKFLIYYLPFIVLAGVVALYFTMGIWSIVTVYFFWQWFHYTRQSYGISAFYRRKSGIENSITPERLDYLAIWAVPLWGLVHRCSQGWDSFLFLPVWLPHIPFWVDVLVGAIASLVALFWIVTKIFDLSRGNLAYAPFFFVLSHNIIFFISYIFIPDITIGWLVVNIWHNAQYILFVWLFNQNRFEDKKMKEASSIMYWLCKKTPYRIIAYFALFIGITTIVYGTLGAGIELISKGDTVLIMAISIVLYQTLNFHHYVVDSLIWKARKKSNQKIMKIT